MSLGLGVTGCAAFSGLAGYSQSDDGGAEGGGGSSADDASGEDAGTSPVSDASPGDAPQDLDAAAVCRAQCSGCCDTAGVCHGGQSTTTCGAGGAACRDCSASNLACDTGGTCVAPPRDAGSTPRCSVSQCTNKCPTVPLLEAPCCKADQTCGCGAVLGILLCN